MIEREQLSEFRVRFTCGQNIVIAERVSNGQEAAESFLVREAYWQKKGSRGPLKTHNTRQRVPRWRNVDWFPTMQEAEKAALYQLSK